MGDAAPLDWMLRRDRRLVLAALSTVVVLAWGYLLLMAGMDMSATMAGMSMPVAWSPGHAAFMALMWVLMMLAMMLPSAAPMILLHATVSRRRDPDGGRRRALFFALGYAAIWIGFAVAATAVHWALERAGLLTSAMAVETAAVASALFVTAGVYQFTPLKRSCLQHCRSPLELLAGHWREGAGGALMMGARHGAYCLGCCWAMMLLLFAGGVMNLTWIAGLALLVLVEKLMPSGPMVGRVLGAALIVWGTAGFSIAVLA